MITAAQYQIIQRSVIRGCFFCAFVLIAFAAQAQNKGALEVIKDPRIDTLAARRLNPHTEIGRSVSTGAVSEYGFRVQIFTGANRKEAFNAQTRFQEHFPDMRTYIIYKEPNFKVRAGDFRTRIEAEKMMQELRPWFTGMFIISEKINLPKPDSTPKTDTIHD